MTSWPLFDLVVTTPRLSLRMPREDELMLLADRACGNVVDKQNHHFLGEWTKLSAPQFQWQFLQFHWQMRGEISPNKWNLLFAVFPNDEEDAVGIMQLLGSDFKQLGKVGTASWILLDRQGQGFGKEARAAALHLAFAELGAKEAQTQAMWPDNQASNKVSLSLGYQPNGHDVVLSAEGPVEVQNYRLSRDQWEEHRRQDVQVEGIEGCLDLLGLTGEID